MKRKLLLSLGSIVAFTPIVAVVACGKIQEPTSTDLDNYRKLTSSEAVRIFEEKWAEEVLKQQSVDIFPAATESATGLYKLDANKTILKDVVFYILRNEIAKDKNYLNKISTQLLANRVNQWADATKTVDIAYLAAQGLAKIYENQYLPANAVTVDGMNILLNFTQSDFRLKVYKQLVAEQYLKINKSEYSKAFVKKTRDLSLLQQDIEYKNFALVNEALEQKLFAEWNVTLDRATSLPFMGNTFTSRNDVRVAIWSEAGKVGTLANVALNSQTKIKEHEEMIADLNYNNMIGWKGYVSVQPVGTNALSFTREELRKMTSTSTSAVDTQWEGILQDDNLATSGINYIQDKADSINITYMKGVMPTFSNNEFTFTGTEYANKLDNVIRLLAYKNAGLYKNASEFFRTALPEITNPDGSKIAAREAIILKLTNEASDIKTILQDANFEFIKERTAE